MCSSDLHHGVEVSLDDVTDNTYVFAKVPPGHYSQVERGSGGVPDVVGLRTGGFCTCTVQRMPSQ